MKTRSATLLNQISKTEIESLTMEVKETLAPGYHQNVRKKFTAAELWNIQRQRKGLPQRRVFGS